MNILKPGGRAAIVLPDNVLFEEHIARDVFEILMEDCNLHTILRLPRGTFSPYSPGVKANVIFFTKGIKTEKIWIYDARTNIPSITKKDRPLALEHFLDFEKCFGSDSNGHPKKARQESERFKCFTREDIKKRNNNLDILWFKEESIEDSEELPEPEDLVVEAMEHLKNATDRLNDLMLELGPNGKNKDGNSKYGYIAESASILLERIQKERKKFLGKRFKEFDLIDKFDLPELPENWAWAPLGNIIASAQPGFASGKKNVVHGLYHLRMNNIDSECTLNLNLVRTVPKQLAEEKYLLKKGDVLICHTNSQKLIGKTAIFNIDGVYAFSNHLTRIRFFDNTISPEWVWFYLSTLWHQGYFESRCKQWVNQATIEKDVLLNIPIPVPPPEEQKSMINRIQAFFDKIAFIERTTKTTQAHCKKLTQSILAKAFRGELVR